MLNAQCSIVHWELCLVHLMDALRVRLATIDEVSAIAACRRAMFADMGETDGAQLDAMAAAFEQWARAKMARGDYFAWVAEAEGQIVASTGLWLMEWSPMPRDLSQRRGRVMDVYVAPNYRRRGLARQLMLALMQWSREHGLQTLMLNASAMGRGLYEELGFEAIPEMVLRLE